MEKWEQAIKTAVNPAMPSELEERIGRTLQQLPRQERKAKMYYALPAAILAVCILFAISAISPAVAETMRSIPVIGSVFEKVGNIGERKVSQQGLVSPLGQQVVIDGETIAFTEVLYDGSSIHIGYTRESPSSDVLHDILFWIDGERLTDYTGGAGGRELENGVFAGIFTIHLQQQLPDSFTLGLSSRRGELWKVELPVTLQGENRVYAVNETREWRGRTLIYDQIGFYSASTVLSIRWLMDEGGGAPLINYQIFDDRGRVLQPFGGGAKGAPVDNGQYVFASQFKYEPLDTVPASLTIKPYIGIGSATGVKSIKQWTGQGFELSQGEVGSVKIESIERQDNNFTITYEVEGELTDQRVYHLWMENEYGERYETIQQPQRLEGTVNRYQATFASKNANDDVMVATQQFQPIAYLEDLAITIKIDN